MTRAASWVVMGGLLALASCRPPTPAPAPVAAKPQLPPAPEQEIPIEEPELAVVIQRGPKTPGVPAPGVGADQTKCERACAEVHDCTLFDPAYTPAAATAIELGCLGACVNNPEPTGAQLFGCDRPDPIEPVRCGHFLECLGPVWPEGAPPPTPTNPVVVDSQDGCTRACQAFARCFDRSTTAEQIDKCSKQCRETLTPEFEQVVGECTDLPNCEEITACIMAMPGA